LNGKHQDTRRDLTLVMSFNWNIPMQSFVGGLNVVKEENIRTLIHIVGTDLFYLEQISSAFTT